MTQYKIERWDAILDNDVRVPAIYIKPDIHFMNLISKNNVIYVDINNTKTHYDHKRFVGLANQSSYFPNCRPNFYAQTGLFIITLTDSPWIGYPDPNNLGIAKLSEY
jgi:hypothetical protein